MKRKMKDQNHHCHQDQNLEIEEEERLEEKDQEPQIKKIRKLERL